MVHNLVHNLCESLVTNIGDIADTGKRTPPTPITYLTQWKMLGNSEVHGNEIWSCGEYNAVDGKYHIFVQPQGGSIADIALDEPLRKVNDIADTIEFPSNTEGKALVTRNIGLALFKNMTFVAGSGSGGKYRWQSYYIRSLAVLPEDNDTLGYLMCNLYSLGTGNDTYRGNNNCIALERSGIVSIYDSNYDRSDGKNDLLEHIKDGGVLYVNITPTTELVDAPQIEEAESYTCVISQGAKAVEWSSFETN